MFVSELWRYPVKSMAGERLTRVWVSRGGFTGDRTVLVGRAGGLVTSRTHHRLLGLKGIYNQDGAVRISGHLWDSPEALALVQQAAGPDAAPLRPDAEGHFDVLPLLVATDGAIAHMQLDGRRLRPNIVVSGVEGLAERDWPGHKLRIGEVIISVVKLRARCVMTTYDPDTLKQDLGVLRSIVRELDGTLALDCEVVLAGSIEVGEAVTLVSCLR